MAGDLNIDSYLDVLHRRLRTHHDRDGILDEIGDHLHTTTERLVGTGVDRADAEAQAVATFGQPSVIAEALLAANGAPAVPTTYTQGIGVMTVVGSAAWLMLPASFWTSHLLEQGGRDWDGLPRVAFMFGMAGLAACGVLTLLLMLALRTRIGGFGVLATVGIGVTGLATAASAVAWAVPLWAALFAVGCLPVAVAAVRHGAVPVRWAVVFGAAWPLGLASLVLLRATEFGGVDEYGDYPAAYFTGMTVGGVAMFAAFLGLGRWLRSEEPVDQPPHGPALA